MIVPYPQDYWNPPEEAERPDLSELLDEADWAEIHGIQGNLESLRACPELTRKLHDHFYGEEPHEIDYEWLWEETAACLNL